MERSVHELASAIQKTADACEQDNADPTAKESNAFASPLPPCQFDMAEMIRTEIKTLSKSLSDCSKEFLNASLKKTKAIELTRSFLKMSVAALSLSSLCETAYWLTKEDLGYKRTAEHLTALLQELPINYHSPSKRVISGKAMPQESVIEVGTAMKEVALKQIEMSTEASKRKSYPNSDCLQTELALMVNDRIQESAQSLVKQFASLSAKGIGSIDREKCYYFMSWRSDSLASLCQTAVDWAVDDVTSYATTAQDLTDLSDRMREVPLPPPPRSSAESVTISDSPADSQVT